MKISITGKPSFGFTLTPAQISVIIKLGACHYDATCRAAAQPESHRHGIFAHQGIFQDWKHLLEYNDGAADFEHISATWREIDLVLKVLEGHTGHLTGDERATANDLYDTFSDLLRAAGPIVSEWQSSFTSPTGISMNNAEKLAGILAANTLVLSNNTRALLFEDGKYVVVMSYDQPLRCVALRHGEPWRDLIGDNLVAAMFNRICELQEPPERDVIRKTFLENGFAIKPGNGGDLAPYVYNAVNALFTQPTIGYKAFTGQRPWSTGGMAPGPIDAVMASPNSGKSTLGDGDDS